ncbi:hypothetical protein AB0G02_36085, partial [Actinosynnema sp. NPDC023658]|uniref:hypothetical protein n=1 Tax=Actinosynnema sp. NPDC023658 TaxID=3155465 RepID=UPI0033D69CCC
PREVTANVRSGDFDMRVPRDGERYAVVLSVESGVRVVDVEQDGSARNRIDVQSRSGDVRIRYDE